MGYFIDNKDRASHLNSLGPGASKPLTLEQFFNQPGFLKFFPKFYELVPGRVSKVDYSNGNGKIEVDKIISGDDDDVVDAYPINKHIKKFPKVNDMVLLYEYQVNLDKYQSDENDPNYIDKKDDLKSEYYYIDILNLKDSDDFNYKNLYPIKPEDVIFQGESGQSIRFTSSVNKTTVLDGNVFKSDLFGAIGSDASILNRQIYNNTWTRGVIGGPMMVLSTGRPNDFITGNDHIEDINLDHSSIYMTSDSIIPLNISQKDSYFFRSKFSSSPPSLNSLNGAQIILTSDNLIFKSRKNTTIFSDDNVWINSSKSIVLTSNGYIILEPINNGKIHLGRNARFNGGPAARADKLIKILKDLLQVLVTDFKLNTPTPIVATKLMQISEGLENIKSSNTFIL